MKLTLMTCLLFALVSFDLSAKVREMDFGVTGAFENFDESIFILKSGTVNLIDSRKCGLFKCHWRNFILKNQEGNASISLNKEGIRSYYDYDVRPFGSEKVSGDFIPFSLTSSDSQLKLNFKSVLKDTVEEYRYTVVPKSCEEICTNRVTDCQFGDADEFGNCRGPVVTRCEESATKCTPSYEVCYHELHSKASLVIDFVNASTGITVGRFTSKEVPHINQKQVPMPKCFGQ